MEDKRIVILGANSAIAQAVARVLCQKGAHLHLIARDSSELERNAADLRIRSNTAVTTAHFEATAYQSHETLLQEARNKLGGIDGIILAFGALGEQKTSQQSFPAARSIFEVNFTAAASLLEISAKELELQGKGFLVAISSVAGDRGRAQNYIYGSAKAALTTYMEGLRCRFYDSDVQILTVKPGPVDTPMTEGMNPPFMISAERAGSEIVLAIERGRETVYVPWYWGPIMAVLRVLPQSLFSRIVK